MNCKRHHRPPVGGARVSRNLLEFRYLRNYANPEAVQLQSPGRQRTPGSRI